jgi:excisionase family DNA binding protein
MPKLLMIGGNGLDGHEGFVTVRAAAQYLALAPATLYAIMARGELRYAKFGRSRRVSKADLVEYGLRKMTGSDTA